MSRSQREQVRVDLIDKHIGDLTKPSHEVVFAPCIQAMREMGLYSRNTLDVDIRAAFARTYRRMQFSRR